jgi:hypothetical protein
MTGNLKAMRFAVVLAVFPAAVLADSDAAEIQALKVQIEALQARVKALEAQQTFTSFMPNLAERFHVMHRGGDETNYFAIPNNR